MVTAARVRRRSHSVHASERAPRFALPFFASRRPCRRYLSVSVAVALCTVVAPVPVTVRTKVPRGALRLVVILRVALPGATTEVGVKLALAPLGRPLTLRLTDPLKLPWDETETVYAVDEPRLILRELGLMVSEKSGGGLTTSVAGTVRVVEPLVPLTVRG